MFINPESAFGKFGSIERTIATTETKAAAALGKTSFGVSYTSTGNNFLDSLGIQNAQVSNIRMSVNADLPLQDFLEVSAHESFHVSVAQNFPNFAAAGLTQPNRSPIFQYLSGFPLYFEEVGAYAYGSASAGRYGSTLLAPVNAFGSLNARQNAAVLGLGVTTAGGIWYNYNNQ
jgi:hypothetical protein